MLYAKVIEDSTCDNGKRLTTLELQYQRFIHGEVMTHRVFSRNAMSSRAIPVAKMIEQVRTNPAMPVHWGKNQSGMQASAQLEGVELAEAKAYWAQAAKDAADTAEYMSRSGAHKQVVNRILEPFQWMRTIVTATEWDNFFALRCHKDAQPEFQALAHAVKLSMAESTPTHRGLSPRDPESWHLPYVTGVELTKYAAEILPRISAARCARVSYLTHDGDKPYVSKDLELFDKLVGSTPLHASPIEHQATPAESADARSNNFLGWVQFRQTWEAQTVHTLGVKNA